MKLFWVICFMGRNMDNTCYAINAKTAQEALTKAKAHREDKHPRYSEGEWSITEVESGIIEISR